MASSSDYTIRDDMTFTDVFYTLRTKFGLPLPPEEITQETVGKDAYDYFAQTKFLLTYSRRNFAAAVREFEIFANLDNLPEETLSKASGVSSAERRQAVIQKRRIVAFNQELKKQLRLFHRDGGSIVTQGNQRQSILSASPVGKHTTTLRSSSIMKASDKTRQRIMEWQQNTNMAESTNEGGSTASRPVLRGRESFDNEINAAFPDYIEEATEIDLEVDSSGMIPARSFRAEKLPGTLTENPSYKSNTKPFVQSNPATSSIQTPHPFPSSHPLDTSVHSPPAKLVASQNHNWGVYKAPDVETYENSPSKKQHTILTQVSKPSNKHIPTSKSLAIPASISNSFPPSAGSDSSSRRLRMEGVQKRKQQHSSRDVMERPSKRQSPGPQDRTQSMNIATHKPVPGPSSRVQIRKPSYTENQKPLSISKSNARDSFSTDTTEESVSDSMLRSRTEYVGTQPTSFNSTMEGKVTTAEEEPGRYDSISKEFAPSSQMPQGRSHVGVVPSSHADSICSTSSINMARPVMRTGNRPASPSTQLQSELEQASGRGSYSVGGSTIDEMRNLGLPGSPTNKTRAGQRSPPAAASTSRTPRMGRSVSIPPNAASHTEYRSPDKPNVAAAQSGEAPPRRAKTKEARIKFYNTVGGELFPGDNYGDLFSELDIPLWIQWEVSRIILTTHARNSEAADVPGLLRDLLEAFVTQPDIGHEQAQDLLKEFAFSFKPDGENSFQNIKRESFAAIFQSETKWDNKIQLSAELKYDKFLDPETKRQCYKYTLRPRPLNLRPKSTRYDRKFGSHRFMYLRIPKLDQKSNLWIPETEYAYIAEYLSHEGIVYMGRRWRAIHHRASSKDENGRRISLAKQDKNIHLTIIMFAESGPALSPRHQLEPVDYRKAVEWLISIEPNHRMTQCKFYARIALGFSTTSPTVTFEPDEIELLEDITTESLEPDEDGKKITYCLTDGCGLVSPAVMREVARHLGLIHPPSAVQARIAAAKGLWIVDPKFEPESDEMWIGIRGEQNKFKGISLDKEHLTLDICNVSKPLAPSALNLQFIVILLHNGVPVDVLEELLREDIRNEVKEIFVDGKLNEDGAFLRKYVEKVKLNGSRRNGKATAMKGRIPLNLAERVVDLINAGFTLQNKTLMEWFEKILIDHCQDIKDKMRIRIARSCQPYCVPDPTGKLKKGQVFLRFSSESKFINPKTMMPIDVLQGEVLIGRNPAHFGSDIQKVMAIDIPELRYLTDVIVFPADPDSHDRSLADYLSGGDYDGDRVWTCWDQRMVASFNGEPVHGPSTVNIDPYFEADHRKMRDVFMRGKETPKSFANFMQDQLKIAMREDLLGQCTTYFEKFVYHNHSDVNGVLNLTPAKELGVACGKLVDAPKQGKRFKPDCWEKHFKARYQKLVYPWYKKKDKELDIIQQQKARKSNNPIDKLKFQVAADEISSLLAIFQQSCVGASCRDDDLVAYSQQTFQRYDALMHRQDINDDHFLKQKAAAYKHQKNHLNRKLEDLKQKWRERWSDELQLDDERGREESKAFIDECVDDFDSILPCEDDKMAGKLLIDEWMLHKDDPYSDWYRLKVSLLHEKVTAMRGSISKLPWFVAGDIYCFEKWRAVSEERRSGFITSPIAKVSRIKSSALTNEVGSRDWIGEGEVEEINNQADSDEEYDD